MEKVGFKGTFWIWGKGIGNVAEQQGKPRMTWVQMKEMACKGLKYPVTVGRMPIEKYESERSASGS